MRAARHRLLLACVLAYAVIEGLRTVADFDLGWQIAVARHPWLAITGGEALSYTAPGAAWIYPPLAGLVFRAVFAVGGYAAISWFCCAALLATVAIVSIRSRVGVLLLMLVAMPALANQILPRSGLFTVVLAAAFSRILLSRRALFLLPLLMVLWVNLHPGFVAGLALLLAAMVGEALEPSARPHARRRLLPWAAATAAATLVNPWGWRMYQAVWQQERPEPLQAAVIRELQPLYQQFSWGLLRPQEPLSSVWWILAASIAAALLLAARRRFGRGCWLAAGVVVCLYSARTQGVFLPLACLIAGDAFTGEARRLPDAFRRAVVMGVLLLAAVRSFAVVTQRDAIRDDQITTFGTGASWWLPQAAAAFVVEHRLPAQMFASFNLSSYLAQRLGPAYRIFADGRYFPFGDRIVAQQLRLASLPLDDPEWTRAATRWDIRTVFLPLARFYGLGSAPLLADCNSAGWTPVFLDTSAAIFVRNDALPGEALAQMRVDCGRQPLVSPAAGVEGYQRLADAAVILYILGRSAEAATAVRQAQQFTRLDDSMFLLAGQMAAGAEARRALEGALALHPSDAAWTQLGIVATGQGDLPSAMDAFRHAAALEHPPSFSLALLTARTELLASDPSAALRTLSAARIDASPWAQANLDDLQAAAWAQLGDWPAAIAAEQHALAQTPQEMRRWQALAAIYTAAGQPEQAAKAARGGH